MQQLDTENVATQYKFPLHRCNPFWPLPFQDTRYYYKYVCITTNRITLNIRPAPTLNAIVKLRLMDKNGHKRRVSDKSIGVKTSHAEWRIFLWRLHNYRKLSLHWPTLYSYVIIIWHYMLMFLTRAAANEHNKQINTKEKRTYPLCLFVRKMEFDTKTYCQAARNTQ